MKKIISLIITLIISLMLYYFTLPALNIHNPGLYFFLLIISIIYAVVDAIIEFNKEESLFKINGKRIVTTAKYGTIYVSTIIGIILLILVINIFNSPIFNAKKYQTRITTDETSTFEDDIPEVNFNQLPLLDRDSSEVLGDRVMGQISDLVSQFDVSNEYTQINYNDTIIRVTPLDYADFFKWLSNRKTGVPGYITVNSVNGESNLIRLDKGMKYTENAYFNENIYRKLRFKYLNENFYKTSFEIDNDGNPYYIVTTVKYVGVGLRPKMSGVIIFDPITGKSTKYKIDEIPEWVDEAYSASLLIEQINDWGTYKNGFLNSIFGQKNVVNTTEGYNYLAMNNDIYLYTGITSVVSDESNLGFVLANMRTGETKYYSMPGAEETSAMNSAQGQVQHMGYESTFPLLINLNGKPTYLVSLKDSSGLVKMYGFIDVKDYQKVVVSDASNGIIAAKDNYLNSIKDEVKDDELTIEEIEIKQINTAIINGYTYYYINTDNNKYKISISLSDKLPFIKVGDKIKIGYYNKDTNIIAVERVY